MKIFSIGVETLEVKLLKYQTVIMNILKCRAYTLQQYLEDFKDSTGRVKTAVEKGRP
jgi:hypothetical protein